VGIAIGALVLLIVFFGVIIVVLFFMVQRRNSRRGKTQVKACYGVSKFNFSFITMTHLRIILFNTTDNVNYEETVNKGRGNAFNAAAQAYEVPMNRTSGRTSEHQGHNNNIIMQMGMHEARYEYATSGPDEQEVCEVVIIMLYQGHTIY
jgi:hypothetical protein